MNKFVKFTLKLLPVLSMFAVLAVQAQSGFTTIRGTLIDEKTREPLPFASIYIKDRTIGTTSNLDGTFEFHIPNEFKEELVVISFIGYKSSENNIDYFKGGGEVTLSEETLFLEEVVVSDDQPQTGKDVVKLAYKAIKDNYPTEPYIIEGFVRDLQNEDGKFVELLECAAKFYYKDYKHNNSPLIELQEVRRSFIGESHPWNEGRQRSNSLFDIVEDDFLRFDYGPIKPNKGWDFTLETVLPYNNSAVYKVVGTIEPFRSAVLYIDVDSYAFVRMEYTRHKNEDGEYWRTRTGGGPHPSHYDVVFEYQEYKGKWYLKYQKEEDAWDIWDSENPDELLFTKYPKKELFVNKIIAEDVENYPFKKNVKAGSIESQAKPYNPEFWKYYNAPAQTSSDSKILAELSKAKVDTQVNQ